MVPDILQLPLDRSNIDCKLRECCPSCRETMWCFGIQCHHWRERSRGRQGSLLQSSVHQLIH